jgi:hypothetical protein
MVGPYWPSEGEIDIIEGVNLNTYDQITLHTSSGCVPSVGSGGQTGSSTGNADCGAGGGYTGCGVISNDATSYGTAFNANGGGTYATLWTSTGIKVWYFASRNVPSDIKSGNPNPAGWGTPTANFGGCNFDSFFKNLQLVSLSALLAMGMRRQTTNNLTPRSSTSRSAGNGPVLSGAARRAPQ